MTIRSLCALVVALAGFLTAPISSSADTTDTALAKSSILESNVAYLQIIRVDKNLADEINAAQSALLASNIIGGTVLDLRFANGDDLAAAQTTEKLFESEKLPLAILVNRETDGAAETLASDLQAAHAGLIFDNVAGTNTNIASIEGDTLRPDIVVAVGHENERTFMKNPFWAPAQAGTNSFMASTNNPLPPLDYTSEADLVREKTKDGDQDESALPPKAEPQMPIIRDPALAQAVDLIKGLAALRLSHI